MTWAGTGVIWMLSGGLPRSVGLASAEAASALASNALTFLQISDSHVGFDKPANPDALATLREAVAKIKAMPARPSFMIHTGDISHLSKEKEFDDAEQIIKEIGVPVFYVPGEHDLIDEENGNAYRHRFKSAGLGMGQLHR